MLYLERVAFVERRVGVLSRATKRAIDIFVAVTGLLILSPAWLIVALICAVYLGRPIFFKQQRPGLRGEPFTVIKFRSMRDATDHHGNVLPDEQRLTKFGILLRRTSLDEIPQLWNVLRGQVSLVGPRPLLMEYLPLYTPAQMRRHEMRPGITGWAQVNGRNAVDWDQRFELDVWYVDNWSLWLDIKIIAKTFVKVVKGDGVAAAGVATMRPFTGSRQSASMPQQIAAVKDSSMGDSLVVSGDIRR